MAARTSYSPLWNGTLGLVFGVLLVLAGCGQGDSDEDGRDKQGPDLIDHIPADSSARADSLAHNLASRYLSYAYRGATLRSSHPLNDSLFALKKGKGVGGPVVLVDTFTVDAISISHRDSVHTVQVRAPHALTISSVWQSSNPRSGADFEVRIEGSRVAIAPRMVGWPALRRHVLRVEADSGEAIVERLQRRWSRLREQAPAV